MLREESRFPYGLERSSQPEPPRPPTLEWRESESAVAVDYVYTGKEYDEETGLIYFGGRYYAPELGRWITPDPLFLEKEPKKVIEVPKELNLYAYVQGNPMTYRDINGFRADAGLENGRWYGDFDTMGDSVMTPAAKQMVKRWGYSIFEDSQIGGGLGGKIVSRTGPFKLEASLNTISGNKVYQNGIGYFEEDKMSIEVQALMIKAEVKLDGGGLDVNVKYDGDWYTVDKVGKIEFGGSLFHPTSKMCINGELHINSGAIIDVVKEVTSNEDVPSLQ